MKTPMHRDSVDPSSLAATVEPPRCRLCGAPLRSVFVDLGAQPLCESYLGQADLHAMEPFYPLRTYVCDECLLVQAEDFASPEQIFREYAYFSSYSSSWLDHAAQFCDASVDRLGLDERSFVVEVASNDGYLLRNFVRRGIPALGIEPARNVAKVAIEAGVPTLPEFFGLDVAARLAETGPRADLLVANNVLAHVPDLHDFVAGIAALLNDDGVASLEFAHLLRLMEGRQFDTIYHEHFSYLTLHVVERLLAEHGLAVIDVEELPTHGGSLRVWAAHRGRREELPSVAALRRLEEGSRLHRLEGYLGFEEAVRSVKRRFLSILIEASEQGLVVAGYGAPGKGNTLLNFCGVREDLIRFTVDRNPYKQGRYLPGTHIPIHHPDRLDRERPDLIVILPWNLRDEIMTQLDHVRAWGARFVLPIPEPEIVS